MRSIIEGRKFRTAFLFPAVTTLLAAATSLVAACSGPTSVPRSPVSLRSSRTSESDGNARASCLSLRKTSAPRI